ncbi:ParB/RepB/Spo0J family partition protein [Deinococcus sp. HMF7620]|uniref:ParB/RepB/Spo0J family partition protein n=1 Tax=Deinococcus arboris TaxID=2682977 RepID=A0A7C9I192_9DEIO|nr:ParB/RepB/Spo0J family partition protein [Deinococcus arboris]MVN88748.1 ParB/RepB/Spo0J family partition protein [Deinococcus arboris]
MPTATPAKPSRKKPSPAAATAPMWYAGDCVLCRPNGSTVLGAVLEVHAHLCTVQHRGGTLNLPLADIVGPDDYPAMLPLQFGDRVRLKRTPGRTYQVMAAAELESDVQVMDLDSGEESTVPATEARVARRVDPQHLVVDLGFAPVPEQLVTLKAKRKQAPVDDDLPFPVDEATIDAALKRTAPEQPVVPSAGWLFPNGSHLAHWGDGAAVLCGRMMPAEPTPISSTDPLAYEGRQCSKCVKSLKRAALDALASLIANTYRVQAVFPDGVLAEGTVRSGKPHGRSDQLAFNVTRDVDGKFFDLSPDLVAAAPRLTIGDRVWLPGSPADGPAVITAFCEERPLQAKLTYDSGQPGGAHVANLLRFQEAPSENVVDAAAVEASPAPSPSPERFEIPHVPPLQSGLREIPWNQLVNSELNPRKHFDQAALEQLAVSIARSGVKQNLQARPHPTRPGLFEIVAGERRWRAIGLLVRGLEIGEGDDRETLSVLPQYLVPVRIEELTDAQLVQAAMAENMNRNDMLPLETAYGYRRMHEDGMAINEIARVHHRKPKVVTRLVQISRSLIDILHEPFNTGKLSEQQAELLALAPPAAQEAVWQGTLRHGASLTVDQLRIRIMQHVMPTSAAQFPRSWYTGEIQAADLFGDMPEVFSDFGQAMACQERHAVALAEKDVARGAAFADVEVRAEATLWKYQEGSGTGTFYWINALSGELKRYERLGLPNHTQYSAPKHRFLAPIPVPVHETPKSASPQAGTPNINSASTLSSSSTAAAAPSAPGLAQPRYPQVTCKSRARQALLDASLRRAAYVYTALIKEWSLDNVTLVQDVVELLDGLVRCDAGELKFVAVEDGGDTPELAAMLPPLMALPEDLLGRLHDQYVANTIVDSLDSEALTSISQANPATAFQLTKEFLEACNHEALCELWDDAGMGDRSNTSDGYLRSVLLEEASRLLLTGFLPQPLR